MSLFSKWFGKEKTNNYSYQLSTVRESKDLPKAVAFIDYEHWFISMQNNYGRVPDIKGWIESVRQKCDLTDVIFFGNFTKFKNKEAEVKRIRSFTNKIIDTFNPDLKQEKDYTDFIILDNIYQRAMQNDSCDMFIIFTGDGHFNSVVAFLRTFCRKEVGIYGIKGCINNNLYNSASFVVEIPDEFTNVTRYNRLILSSLHSLINRTDSYPTFKKTVEKICRVHEEIDEEDIRIALQWLIDKGYIKQVQKKIENRRGPGIKVLEVNWNKVYSDKIWNNNK